MSKTEKRLYEKFKEKQEEEIQKEKFRTEEEQKIVVDLNKNTIN